MKLKSVYRLISPEHRRRLPAIVLSALGSAMVDLVGIAALVSVLLVVLDENILHTNPLFASLYSALGFGSEGAFIAVVCVVVLIYDQKCAVILYDNIAIKGFANKLVVGNLDRLILGRGLCYL
jgi:hypothetical protein